MRSKLEAPTNPSVSVCSLMKAASSGVLIGPPWLRKMRSLRTDLAASMMPWVILAASGRLIVALVTPIEPPTVVPTWAMMTSAPASAMARDSSGEPT